MNWYLDAFKYKYADFEGRARRTEYWMFSLFHVIILILLMVLAVVLSDLRWGTISWTPLFLYILVSFIPTLALTVRRLHDSGKSGWFYLFSFIPYIGGIILLVFTLQNSENMTNKWGPNPKGPNIDEINEIGNPLIN